MPIAYDNASSNRFSVSSATSLSYSFNRASGLGVVFVAVVVTDLRTVTSCTLGGETMTQVGSRAYGSGPILYLFRLRNPATSGSQTIAITLNASANFLASQVISFTGDSDTNTNIETFVATSVTTLVSSLTVSNGSWCVLAASSNNFDLTAGTGVTALTVANPLLGRNGPRSGAGTTSMTVNAAGSDVIGSIICEIREPGGGPIVPDFAAAKRVVTVL